MKWIATALLCSAAALRAQSALTCVASANPPILRAEGLAERTGDVVFSCSGGQPNTNVTGNLALFLSVNVTNRILADGATDVLLTVNGTPANVAPRIAGVNSVVFNGLTIPITAQGTASLHLENLRGNASQLLGMKNQPIVLYPSFSGAGVLVFTSGQFSVGIPQTSLLAGSSGALICSQAGSPLPASINFATLAANAVHAATRVTEGFASAFAPLSDFSNQRADSGVRIVVRYAGFTSAAHLFVPDAIAGSDATAPTSAGEFGIPASGGVYTPARSQLLLIRVNNASANGAGGTLAFAAPSIPTAFNTVSELAFSNGSAWAVYEVVDSNPALVEGALVPAFLGLASGGTAATTTATVTLAPVSTVAAASTSEAIPRYAGAAPPADCTVLGDCGAAYFPHLTVIVNGGAELALTPGNATGYVIIQNSGSGILSWSASTTAPYLTVSPSSGTNNGGFRVDAAFALLTPGVYHGTVTVDAGPLAGSQAIPVTVTVPVTDPVPPHITAAGNAADPTIAALVPGSLATIFGSRFTAKTPRVTFDNADATVIFASDTQINLVVPSTLAAATSQIRVIADGIASAPFSATIAAVAPAIFPGAVLNTDWSPNTEAAPAPAGSTLQIFATGLPANGAIEARIHDRQIVAPAYAGPAPGIPGLYQINAQIPADLPAMQTWAYVCAAGACSPPVKLWLSR